MSAARLLSVAWGSRESRRRLAAITARAGEASRLATLEALPSSSPTSAGGCGRRCRGIEDEPPHLPGARLLHTGRLCAARDEVLGQLCDLGNAALQGNAATRQHEPDGRERGRCEHCNAEHDRDVNAAVNILAKPRPGRAGSTLCRPICARYDRPATSACSSLLSPAFVYRRVARGIPEYAGPCTPNAGADVVAERPGDHFRLPGRPR